MLLLLFPLVVSVLSDCPANTVYLSQLDKCVTVVQNEAGPKTSFDEADRECHVRGGQLTSIHNGFENTIILEYFREITVVEQTLIGTTLNGSNWGWTDGTTMEYTNWAFGQPASPYTCAQINHFNGKWYTIDCNTSNIRYLCTIPSTPPNPRCPSGWSAFNGSCYFFQDSYPTQQYDWTSARKVCTQSSGDLVSIHSPEENQFVTNFAQPESCFLNPYTWIGLQWNQMYTWSDESDVSFVNTSYHERNPPIGYVIFPSCHRGAGGWIDYEITDTFYSFVCKKAMK